MNIFTGKTLRVAMSAAMVSTMMVGVGAWSPTAALGATANTSWYSSGADSYTLKDARDLAGLAQLVNSGTSFQGKTVLFKENTTLKLSGDFTPIGNAKNSFDGTFDGQGLSVTGFSIASGTSYLGLFGNAGADSTIKNVKVTGSITLSPTKASKSIVSYVGGVVGNTKGSLVNCDSAVKISIKSSVAATSTANATVHDIGGVAGRAVGDVTDCDTTSKAAVAVSSTSAPASDEVTWVAGYVGGVIGYHGPDVEDLTAVGKPSTVSNCTNKAKVSILTTAAGSPDRFGNPTNANSRFIGGISGYESGNVTACVNSGAVDSAYRNSKGKAQNAYGTVAAGGIVGGLRIDSTINGATDTNDPGLRYEKKNGQSSVITVSDCTNTALVFGLAQAGGIVGQAGAYTYVTRCVNSGDVEGSRYTKPSPGGIVGRGFGDISYCYNSGNVKSTTGGGYYAAGIVGMFHSIGTNSKGEVIQPECWACYNTGYVLTSASSYRSGSVVGELDDGYIHDTFSLENRANTSSVSGLLDFTGVMVNVKQVKESELSSAKTLSILNSCCDKEGWICYYTLPEGKAYGSGAAPVLARESYASAVNLGGKTASVSSSNTATYSAAIDPVPTVSVTYGGTKLVQNADYRVIPQADTKGANVGSTKYTATIQGIGNYKGVLSTKATYTIVKANISACTLTAESCYFNYAPQKPASVTLFDEGGNVVDSSQYSWDVDNSMFGVKKGSRVLYQDAHDKTAVEGDPIIVTAASNGNYKGTYTFNVFKIKPVSFVTSTSIDNPNQSKMKIGDVVYTAPDGTVQTWKFSDVCSYATNNAIGDSDIRGALKVKYSGEPIKLTLSGITYMGNELKEIKEGDAWYADTKAWGYKLLYGNANPEDAATAASSLAAVTNVTGDNYAVFTIRAAPYSNFDNYVTVWFEITPASLESDAELAGFEESIDYISGKQDGAVFTYNGKKLVEGTDYTATYTYEGTEATVVYQGIGNYVGTITKSFQYTGTIVKAPVKVKAASAKKAKLAVSWSKLSGVDGYQIRYKTGTGKWVTKTAKGAKTVKATYKLKSGKTYKIQVRGYKKSGSVTSCTEWSKTISKKVK